MLDRLLQILAEGGVHSYGDLAERLSVTRPLLETMLDELARLGYLRSVNANCDGQCTVCPVAARQRGSGSARGACPDPVAGDDDGQGEGSCPTGGCLLTGSGKLWTLTERGFRASSPRSA